MILFSQVMSSFRDWEELPFNVELSMEGYIFDNPNVLRLSDEDKEGTVKVLELEKDLREFDGVGRIDILASYQDKTLAIVELKNGSLDKRAFEQLNKYFECKYKSIFYEGVPNPSWMGILVGLDIEDSFLEWLKKNNPKLQDSIPLAVMTVKRYRGGGQIFVFSNVVYQSKSGRDYTKYCFDGGVPLSKNRTVIKLIHLYLEDNKSITKDDVVKLFTDSGISFSNQFPLFLPLDCDEKTKRTYLDPFYNTNPQDVVNFDGRDYAITGFWSKDEMPVIKEIARKIKHPVSEVPRTL